MSEAADLLREGRTRELWDRCCGFIDLSLEQFMNVQRELLLEQIELLNRCELGDRLMRGARPRTVEEFREQVPVSRYVDYAPYLLERMEDVLPEDPAVWQCTSGRSGEFPCKWVPVTRRQYDELAETIFAVFTFASCEDRYQVPIKENDKLLYGLAPPPYVSGSYVHGLADMGIFEFLPPIDIAERMSFEERTRAGLQLGLVEGIDILPGIPSILMAIAERFSQGSGSGNPVALLRKPRALLRLLSAVARSKLARRPIAPKDIWKLKALIAAGSDNSIYREKIREQWGRYPLDCYGSAECSLIAVQTWDYEGMTFVPHLSFLEFMPDDQWPRWLNDRTYRPRLLTLDQVQAGERYALVATNFRGGAFVRYFLGDVVKITALRNRKLNINLPQMVFDSRVDGIIDIGGFARLTEQTIWSAIERAGLPYRDWSARKEADARPFLHVYLEPRPGNTIIEAEATAAIHQALAELDPNYADIEPMLGFVPVRVTVLACGAFQAYIERQRAAGVDLGRIKPPHVNPQESTIRTLVEAGR